MKQNSKWHQVGLSFFNWNRSTVCDPYSSSTCCSTFRFGLKKFRCWLSQVRMQCVKTHRSLQLFYISQHKIWVHM